MAPYELIQGNRHQRATLYKSDTNFYYSRNSKRGEKVYLRCQKNISITTSCPGTAVLDLLTDDLTEGRSHNHNPGRENYDLELDLKKEVKKACETDLSKASKAEIFRNTVRGHPDAEKVAFG